jgi:hypothetical protein
VKAEELYKSQKAPTFAVKATSYKYRKPNRVLKNPPNDDYDGMS